MPGCVWSFADVSTQPNISDACENEVKVCWKERAITVADGPLYHCVVGGNVSMNGHVALVLHYDNRQLPPPCY